MNDFESIYKTYFADVFRYARSLTMDKSRAEDITADTFFRAMRSLSDFRGECDVRLWLCRIAKNLWLTEQKKFARQTDEKALLLFPAPGNMEQSFQEKQTALKIRLVLSGLEEPYQEVFSLRVLGELSFKEIGALFGKNDHWACVTYHRAKEKIQKEMLDS